MRNNFPAISLDQDIAQVESLCFKCRKNGSTKFLLAQIPHFKDVVISAFECPHCGERNHAIQSATTIGLQGVRFRLSAKDTSDLNRQIVRSEYASIVIDEIGLEIPRMTGASYLTTIEGLLQKIIEDLEHGQKDRPDRESQRISEIISRLRMFSKGEPFTLMLDDVTGNSYIENPQAPHEDFRLKVENYEQDKKELAELGFEAAKDQAEEFVEQAYSFEASCPSCSRPCYTRMKPVDIPHFKQVVIMATVCDHCGYKSNEVKTAAAISPRGTRITLRIADVSDLSRDMLKSETCTLEIAELDLKLCAGTLGGRFTTVEGIVAQVREELEGKVAPFASGDSSVAEKRNAFHKLLDGLEKIRTGEMQCTLILDDPLSNSHVQNLYAPDSDPNLTIEEYERTFEQDEDLGINDMKTENYDIGT